MEAKILRSSESTPVGGELLPAAQIPASGGPRESACRTGRGDHGAVEVALQKYSFHMPLERHARRMADEGLRVTPQTFWDHVYALSKLLTPGLPVRVQVLSCYVVHLNETPWKLLTQRPSRATPLFGPQQ